MEDFAYLIRLSVYIFSCSVGTSMFQIMRLHHKNKPLGMQTFLGRVIVFAINIHMVICIFGTGFCMTVELFTPAGEALASLLVITCKEN